MFKSYLERIKEAGVVGAGGAGFPTHIKVNNPTNVVIANGAECEPLLRVDQQIMELYADKIIEGLRIVMKISNSQKGEICLKEKYHKAIEKLKEAIDCSNNKNISLHLIGNYYPAGDEQQLVYEVTGKVVPLGGLPMDVGAIVCNVSTLLNIAEASSGIPVTTKFVTITGAVQNPVTLNVPIGTPIKKLIEIAGGPKNQTGYSVILGGPAMGKVESDWNTPVTKTLGGVIILPNDHPIVKMKTSTLEKDYRLAKSVCCQCNYCTQLCPRNALGLGVEPHKVMRAVAYGEPSAVGDANTVFGCCDCGLCTYYACNMGLTPGKMVTSIKTGLAKKGIGPDKKVLFEVSDARSYKLVPVKRFLERLGLGKYDLAAPIKVEPIEVAEIKIPLQQHIGVPAVPKVKVGDFVNKGDLIGIIEEGKLGANIHASIKGLITSVSEQSIGISRLSEVE
ncbi:MAG: 4Fe-4S dicluster domain-containing protein [Clostridia bacterium]